MKIIYNKSLDENQIEIAKRIANECNVTYDTARLLLQRNIDSVEKAKDFFDMGKHAFNNPFLLSGMEEAVDRISQAKQNQEKVLIFGDYDADGICASTVLFYCLMEFGINARVYVPEREEGYGLNVDTVKDLMKDEEIHLIITVDCGISDAEKIESLNLLGVDVIVTDHHEPPEILPNCICVNPKIKGQDYPFNGLCGAGVAYKLGHALIGDRADDYIDFVALATVSDSMELLGENRHIVYEGLKIFNNPKKIRLPFKYLLSDNNRQISAQTFMYSIAPRVNAGGRMGDAKSALSLFLENDQTKIFDLAVKLNEYNIARQFECDNVYKQAKAQIESLNLNKRNVILVKNENWQVGFVGIVAARLVEEYSRPVIVFAGYDGHLKGSARSIDQVNIFDAITSAKDLLIAFGGHSQAAGVSIEKENFDKLYDYLDQYIEGLSDSFAEEKTIVVDMRIEGEFSIRFAKEIEMLEPFGVGNKRPLFAVDVESVDSMPLKEGSPHYTYKTDCLQMLDFNGEKNVKTLLYPVKKTILFETNVSSYKNRESLKGYVRYVCPHYTDSTYQNPYIFENELNKILVENEDGVFTDGIQILQKISTEREQFITTFNTLKSLAGERYIDSATFAMENFKNGEVYQAIFVLEVLMELKIFNRRNGKLNFDKNIKNALTNSKVYSKICLLKGNLC